MLKNKTAIVTGSTSGIGLSIAKTLASLGANITINGFGDKVQIEEIRLNIEKEYKVKVKYADADMTDSTQIAKMIDDTIDHFNSIDILVNNAGIQYVAPIEEFPENKWNDIIAINLSSAFHTIRHSIKYMKKQNWGRIINIASSHGLVGSPQKAAYVAAKHGIVGLTKVVALEIAKQNITCNAICPGWVLTNLVEKQIEALSKDKNISISQAKMDLIAEKQPSLRFVQPEHIGEFIKLLCSDAGLSINGSALSIDGGWVAI